MGLGKIGLKPEGGLDADQGLIGVPHFGQSHGEIGVSRHIIGLKPDGISLTDSRLFRLPGFQQGKAEIAGGRREIRGCRRARPERDSVSA